VVLQFPPALFLVLFFQSCIFQPCKMVLQLRVLHFQVLNFPVLQFPVLHFPYLELVLHFLPVHFGPLFYLVLLIPVLHFQSTRNGVDHIDTVKLRRARLLVGLVTTFGGYTFRYFPGHSGPLNLTFPPWIGAASTIKRRFRSPLGRNGEFCVVECSIRPGLLAHWIKSVKCTCC